MAAMVLPAQTPAERRAGYGSLETQGETAAPETQQTMVQLGSEAG